jgi:hypothetical protein
VLGHPLQDMRTLPEQLMVPFLGAEFDSGKKQFLIIHQTLKNLFFHFLLNER